MAATPELKAILDTVEAELTAMLLAKEVGNIIVHCGHSDILVEVNRKHPPVRLARKAEPVLRRATD